MGEGALGYATQEVEMIAVYIVWSLCSGFVVGSYAFKQKNRLVGFVMIVCIVLFNASLPLIFG